MPFEQEKDAYPPQDAVLRSVVEGVEAETGEQFFYSLVRSMACALGVQYAFVSEWFMEQGRARTRAVWGRGKYLENYEINLAPGMPCQVALSGRIAHHAARLSFLFPGQPMLDEGRIESYCGLPLLDSAGRVLGHFAVMDDNEMPDPSRAIAVMRVFAARARAEIERVRAEQALRISEQRLTRILDSAMDAIITFDSHGRIEFFSRAAEKIFRCPLAEAIGAPLDRFLTAGFRRALEDSLVAHKADGHGQALLWAPHGLSARGADGREFPVEAALSHVEAGGMQLHTLIVRDIEERRRAEAEMRKLSLQNEYLQDEINATYNFGEIVGECSAMAEVMEKVRLVSQTSATVLILGETGTGKELIARAVHSSGPRRDRPLIKVDCAALPSGLVESELFGHEKGAFTGATEKRIGRFELANEGTIFLDEIGEIPPEVQVKLLRVLQEREFDRIGGRGTVKVDIRIIAATNRDLNQAVVEGKFRQDLFYRLNVFPIVAPPLRHRLEDIPLLVHYFVRRYASRIGRKIDRIPASTMARLAAYTWPGNIRELENVIERAVILSPGSDLELAAELITPIRVTMVDGAPRLAGRTAENGNSTTASSPLADTEKEHIIAVLKRTKWRIEGPGGAAGILKLNPSTLRSRMKKLGVGRSRDGAS